MVFISNTHPRAKALFGHEAWTATY